MAEYYGVTRSPEYLAHYGVLGMKWGVRKAIASGNLNRLKKHYDKANKKLKKLTDKTNINKQHKIADKWGKVSAISGSVGAGALGLSLGAKSLQKKNGDKFDFRLHSFGEEMNRGRQYPVYKNTPEGRELLVMANPTAGAMHREYTRINDKLQNAKAITGGIGIAGLSTSAIAGARSLAVRRRTTPQGHAKAVAKRNAWQREMNKTFAGTRYGKKRHK